MRVTSRSLGLAATSIATVAMLAACGGGSSNSTTSGKPAGADPAQYKAPTATGTAPDSITVYGCNPQYPLVPGNTSEVCGGDPQDLSVAKLMHYDEVTAKPSYDIAKSITTKDNQHFTVTLKPNYKFSDGSTVTASSFVDAWNYTAYGPNAQQGSYFFGPIQGYDAVQCTNTAAKDPCAGSGAPKAKTMTGLKVVNPTTFTITTTEKVSNLTVRLGYEAFAPLPTAFFKNPTAFGQKPIGAGPYMVDHWTKGQEIVLVKNPYYSGQWPGEPNKITFKVYTSVDAAYADLQAGNLDIMNQIPSDALNGNKWLDDLHGDGSTRAVGVIQMIGINPTVDTQLANPDLRKAISMSIDRQAIIDKLFAGTRQPATGWVTPVVDGYKAGACGEWCNYDPTKAKQMWDAAGGYKGTLTLTVNNDGDHGPWAEAACNMIRQNLGVDCTVDQSMDFANFLTQLENKKVKGLFRQGWQMDYPSIEDFLVPLYSKDASSNYYGYDNPKFEQLTKAAAAAPTLAKANSLYQQAEAQLATDMRIIPLWYSAANVGWSQRLNPVGINAFGVPDYAHATLKQ